MKQTNYHLFDFMDFDPTMQREEALWKAYAPTSIVERDGDIVVTIPYQQQRHQEDMDPDTETAQQSYDLIIRAYEPNIIRLFTTMTDDQMTESDEMLLMAPEVKRKPLRYVDGDVIATDGTKVANINLSEPRLDPWSDLLPAPQPAPLITFYPDGDTSKPVALSDDHFSPPRYDALPLGFCSVCCNDTATKNERATISFKCDADEHFVGTGERFRKMDLSGQTFQFIRISPSIFPVGCMVYSSTPQITANYPLPTIAAGVCSFFVTTPLWMFSSSVVRHLRRS